jgi:hypothetical protein
MWPFLHELLLHMGFLAIWLDWVASLLTTASTWATVKGCLTLKIWHARRLRQGDPLSPMLFLLVMEALNAMIRKADDWSLLQPLHLNAMIRKAEHQAIMEVLKYKGFGSKWQHWMDMIMKSGTSSILLNVVLGKVFHNRRGVRQVNPVTTTICASSIPTL